MGFNYDNREALFAIIRGLIPVIATTLTMLGISADADILALAVGGAISLGTFVWSWWKNNNITLAAQEAQSVLDEIKARKNDGSTDGAED